nr:1250_t:CDS:2 [Entrophospora candida]
MDFLKEDFGDKLDVESLKAVREKLNIFQKDNKEIYARTQELEREKAKLTFGKILDLDGLAKVVKRLNDLSAELADKNNEIVSLGGNIESLKNQLSEKEKEIVKKDSDIKLRDETIADKEKNIQQLQKDVNNNKDLSNKIKELEAVIAQSTKELKRETKQELTSFFQDMDISDDDINEKYGNNFDYETVIDEKLTLKNRMDMKKAFKIVACICATEKFEELNKPYEKNPASRTERLQSMLEKIANN